MENQSVLGRMESLKTFWAERDRRILEWYELRRLKDKYKKKGYESAVSNDPKNIIRLATYILSAMPVKHRIPIKAEEPPEQRNYGLLERGLEAIWREEDKRRRRSGLRQWRWSLADGMLMTGFWAVHASVEKAGRKPEFVAEIWNPARVYPDFSNGLLAVMYEYTVGHEALKEKVNELGWVLPPDMKSTSQGAYLVRLLWEQGTQGVVQSVVVSGKLVKERVKTRFKKIPVLVGAVGGEGVWGGRDINDNLWTRHFGESILEPNRELEDALNRWLTNLLQLTKEAARGLIKHRGGGSGTISAEDVQAGKMVDLLPNEDVDRMAVGQIPPEVGGISRIIQEMVQRGSFNWALFGLTGPINLSGVALSQLLLSAYSIVGEQHASMQGIISEVDTVWLEGYRDGKFKPYPVVTRKAGITSPIIEEITPDMVPENVSVEATYEVAAPKDNMERLVAARQAQPDGRLLDPVTILEDIYPVQDPQVVLDRLDEEEFKQLREMKVVRAVAALRKFEQQKRRGKTPDIELAEAIKKTWIGMLQSLGQPPPGEQTPSRPGVPEGRMSPEAAGKPRSLARQMFAPPAPQQGIETEQFPTEV